SKIGFENLIYLRFLLGIDGIGPQKIFSLLSKFHSFENIVNASYSSLSQTEGIGTVLANRICSDKKSTALIKESLKKSLDKLDEMGGTMITYWDDEYPGLLKKIYFPPLIIYTLGNFSESDNYSIAIVGTRQPSPYGKMQAEKFSSEFAEIKITVVSGLARGIDSIAHDAALKKNGRTIAVIGSGLDVIYPPENKKLFDRIKEDGVIITEYDLGTKPDAQNFPRRNRIISGISLGTLIVETKLNGGAMQTAAYALDQDREVFAIPGNVNIKQSEGPNALIQRGEAKLVTCTEDVFLELKLKLKPEIGKNIPKPTVELNLFEEKLISVLDTDAKQIDEIASLSSMTTSDCLVNLLTLEFKGLVKQLPGKMFIRC
ncbi:MAG: DNA-processing protein DprA, partial [Bacteroidota bacterium]